MPALELGCVNRIPLARGLGSSSAAFVSALVAANYLLSDWFSQDELLSFATELEGHPDNVAPALLGGVRASAVFGKQVVSIEWPAPECGLVVAVPAFELSTRKSARRVAEKHSDEGRGLEFICGHAASARDDEKSAVVEISVERSLARAVSREIDPRFFQSERSGAEARRAGRDFVRAPVRRCSVLFRRTNVPLSRTR